MPATPKLPTNETLRADMWRACDILRRDNNVGGVMQYTEHLAWLLFLRFLDLEEKKRGEEAAVRGDSYAPVLQGTWHGTPGPAQRRWPGGTRTRGSWWPSCAGGYCPAWPA